MDEPTEVLFFPVPFWFFCSLRGFKYYLTMPTDTTPLPARWLHLRNLRRLQHQRHWLHRQVGKKMPQKNKANCAGSFNIHGFMYDLYWIVLNPYWWFQLRLSRITRASHPTQTITNKLKHPRLNCHTFEGHSLGIYAVLTCQDFVPQILPPAVFQL